jgi:hypothetical protein
MLSCLLGESIRTDARTRRGAHQSILNPYLNWFLARKPNTVAYFGVDIL